MTDPDTSAVAAYEQGQVVDDRTCFGCGSDNPIGLHLQFDQVADGVQGRFIADRRYQGYRGLLHGGLAATLLDEALAWAVTKRHGPAVTGELHVRHRHPVPVGQPLVISGRVSQRRMTLVEAEGTIANEAGKVLAEGRAKFMLVKQSPGVV